MIIAAVLFLIVNKTETRTLGDLIHNELTSYHVISEFYISGMGDEFTTVTNQKEIEKNMNSFSEMDLKEVDDAPYVQYSVTIRTEENYEITVAVGEERIDVWDNQDGNGAGFGDMYEIEGDPSLLDVIQDSSYEWESWS
ncbi:hypothetical protein [Halobacillus sp. B29]|uniref:hypothetical protein n=1 Tax=Halobacillus sp. B29 TaxID=3457432 RepID=UPI003FCCF04F